jgi:hypothetical protein
VALLDGLLTFFDLAVYVRPALANSFRLLLMRRPVTSASNIFLYERMFFSVSGPCSVYLQDSASDYRGGFILHCWIENPLFSFRGRMGISIVLIRPHAARHSKRIQQAAGCFLWRLPLWMACSKTTFIVCCIHVSLDPVFFSSYAELVAWGSRLVCSGKAIHEIQSTPDWKAHLCFQAGDEVVISGLQACALY